MAAPCALITSCTDYKPENIIKEIFQVEKLKLGKCLLEDIYAFDWRIDTKYYTADVQLCTTSERTIGDQSFADSVEGFVVYFDPDQENSFELVKSWLPYLEQIEPDVKMLVCEKCTDVSKVSRLEAQTWCVDSGFELVELNPETDSDTETEDDFVETTGIKRIVQALHAHTWPNLTLKDSPPSYSPYIRQLMQDEHQSKQAQNSIKENSNMEPEEAGGDTFHVSEKTETSTPITNCGTGGAGVSVTSGASAGCEVNNVSVVASGESNVQISQENKTESRKEKQSTKERLDSMLPPEDLALFEAVGSGDTEEESFEQLFERFTSMKEKASSLPSNERKQYAEKVAVAFWRAMGGDEDEIGSLSDSDDADS